MEFIIEDNINDDDGGGDNDDDENRQTSQPLTNLHSREYNCHGNIPEVHLLFKFRDVKREEYLLKNEVLL